MFSYPSIDHDTYSALYPFPFMDSRANKREELSPFITSAPSTQPFAHLTLSWSYCFRCCINPKRISVAFFRTIKGKLQGSERSGNGLV